MAVALNLPGYIDALTLLGDENRIRLCALLRDRELCVTNLVRVTGIAQSRVSTHLGRLREAGLVRDRRKGPQSFYGLVADSLPAAVRTCLDEIAASGDPTLDGDQERLRELEAERRGDVPEHLDDLEREYSPGRSWQSLTVGIAALLRLGDVLDVGSGDGAAAVLPLAHLHRHQSATDRRRGRAARASRPRARAGRRRARAAFRRRELRFGARLS